MNITEPPRLLTAVGFCITAPASLALSLTVIILSVGLLASTRKDFVLYLLNLAFIDSLFCIHLLLLTFYLRPESKLCPYTGLASVYLGFLVLHAVVPISFNRYIGVCRPECYKQFFGSHLRRVLVLIYPYLAALPAAALHIPLVELGPDPFGIFCLARGPTGVMAALALGNEVTVCLPITFFAFKLWHKIKEMEKVQLSLKKKEKLEETRLLLKAILVQALSPYPLQLPLFLVTALPVSRATAYLWAAASVLYSTVPFFDSSATLLFVKPYRDVLNLRERKKCDADQHLDQERKGSSDPSSVPL